MRCRPTCRWATTACTCAAAAEETSAALIVTPPWLGLAGPAGPPPPVGPGHPALQRPIQGVLGYRRPHGPDRPRGVVGGAARRGLPADQPAARRGSHQTDGTLARTCRPHAGSSNPLYLRVEAIPEYADLPKRKEVRGLHAELTRRAARLDAIDRDAAWKAKRRALKLVHRVKRSAGRELAYAAFRAVKAPRSRRSRHGVRWPSATATTGTTGPSRCATPRPTEWQSSSKSTAPQSISTAGCSGSSTSNSPAHSPRRPAPACRWASWPISRSGYIPTAPMPGRCRTCWHSASPRAHRPTNTTNWARTGRSRRGGPINSSSGSTSRSGS